MRGDERVDVAAGRTELPDEDVPDDEYEFRLPAESSLERWLFFDANRWTVTLVVLAGVFLSFFLLGSAGLVSFRNENTASLLLSVFVAGNFTLISIVITINQLVLSREFGKPHTLRERNEGIAEFRHTVEDLTDVTVGPADPLQFLEVVVDTIDERASSLREEVAGADDRRLQDQVDAYATAVGEQTVGVDAAVAESEFGDFEVLVAMLFYRLAWQIHAVRRLRHRFADSLSESATEELHRQEELLRTFNIARQYVQTLYLQKELAELSRLLLYVGIPSLLITGATMLVYDEPSGITVGAANLTLVFSLVAALAFAPISLLLAYVVRVSTIVSRMPLLSPFINDG